MALKCDNCEKGIMYGHNVSHSKRRTRKIFKPNLHRAKVLIGGTSKNMKLCTKCLRMVKTAMQASSAAKSAVHASDAGINPEAIIEVPQV